MVELEILLHSELDILAVKDLPAWEWISPLEPKG
jgi:hypothetical protein